MSIGLVIANIAGSVRPSTAAVPDGATAEGAVASDPAATAPGLSALNEPVSDKAQLTPGFTVVVLELLNDKGAVVTTVPTARQLAAYRNGTATPPA